MNSQDQNMALERHARGRETELIGRYIEDGPTELKDSLGVDDAEWLAIFDYLVFKHGLLHKSVIKNQEFFVDLYVKHGMTHLREVFGVVDEKYDCIWSIVFDYIAICHEGLKYHVFENRDRYVQALRQRGGDFVRKVLGIWQPKYESHWRDTLDFLLHATCDDIFNEATYDHGLKAFSLIMNNAREQRPLNKFGLI